MEVIKEVLKREKESVQKIESKEVELKDQLIEKRYSFENKSEKEILTLKNKQLAEIEELRLQLNKKSEKDKKKLEVNLLKYSKIDTKKIDSVSKKIIITLLKN